MRRDKSRMYDIWTRKDIKLLEDNFGKLTLKEFMKLSNKTEHELSLYFIFFDVSSKGFFLKEQKPIKIKNQNFFTVKEFAEQVLYHRATVEEWIKKGFINFEKVKKTIYIPKAELDKFQKLEKISSVYKKLSIEKIDRIYNIIEEGVS